MLLIGLVFNDFDEYADAIQNAYVSVKLNPIIDIWNWEAVSTGCRFCH
jgi:hypothetical protein